MANRLCLPCLVSVMQFIAERGVAFKVVDENVGSPRNFFQADFQKRKDMMLLVTGCGIV